MTCGVPNGNFSPKNNLWVGTPAGTMSAKMRTFNFLYPKKKERIPEGIRAKCTK